MREVVVLASLLQAASLAPGPGLQQLSPRTVQRLPPSQATTLAPGLVSAVPLHRDNAGVSSHVSRVMMIVTCHIIHDIGHLSRVTCPDRAAE